MLERRDNTEVEDTLHTTGLTEKANFSIPLAASGRSMGSLIFVRLQRIGYRAMRAAGGKLLVTAALLLFTLPPNSAAQYAPLTPQSYEGQNVSSVVLAGRPDVDTAKLLPLVTQHSHAPFEEKKINESINALKAEGKFKDVELQVAPEADGIRVLFVLHPALYIGIFRFPGATGVFAYSRLLQITNYQEQEPYTPHRAPQAEKALADFFHRSGFFLAQVQAEIQSDETHGLVNFVFHTTLGPRAKFGDLTLEGVTPEESARLKVPCVPFWPRCVPLP